jgi:hypothetical protein
VYRGVAQRIPFRVQDIDGNDINGVGTVTVGVFKDTSTVMVGSTNSAVDTTSGGWWYIDLTATEMNTRLLTLSVSHSGDGLTQKLTFQTKEDFPKAVGTARSVATVNSKTVIELQAGTVVPVAGWTYEDITTGAQSNIVSYDAGTEKATLDPPLPGISGTGTYKLWGSAAFPTVDAIDADLTATAQAALVAALAADATFLAAIAAALHNQIIEGTMTFKQVQRVLLADAAGPSSGLESTTPAYKSPTDPTKIRFTGTADAVGNRSGVTFPDLS